ncbi:diguanylate cyclase [Vibrio astriarenae]|uniref:diguanylate cyclase n=1 Tax=Vibrio astriarenae TaxID=1481923 RepID=A0A7Z2T6J1_9VIBR|nr:GGDEF domain-containing protein [Vibrio astriarenae]QIA65200.1 diguanylate cyclase [Vibrio astriarenae]
MSKEEFVKATENLKKAVPLMMKNKVAPTPANYALWYTYVDEVNPELNAELNTILDNYGECPPSQVKSMYKRHIARQAETDINELRASVELMVSELKSSMTDTLKDTNDFSETISNSFSELERIDKENLSFDEVMLVVRDLVKNSREIRHSTCFLNNQLTSASDEISRLKEQLAKVQQDALFDCLSNLYNRRAFDSDIKALCEGKQPMSLVLLDIDHFKNFNDEFGHLLGDMVIKAIAKRLNTACRDGINAYRFGGEEFALVIPNKSLRIARQFAESLRRSIEKLVLKDRRSGNTVNNITASFGVSEFQETDSPDSLIARADRLLYEAKQLGRNRVMPL